MDWNEPTNSNPAHPNVLADLNNKDSYCATMGQTNAGFTNIPEGTMNWDHGSKFFRRKEGGAFLPVQISLSGGGTGASDAAGARAALEVNKAGQGTAEARTNQQNDQVYCQLSRSINTASPLQGGGQLDNDVNLSIQDATTAQKGAVQLDNTLTSTSTTKALTAAQGKVLNDGIASINTKLAQEYLWGGSSTGVSENDIFNMTGKLVTDGTYIIQAIRPPNIPTWFTVIKPDQTLTKTSTGTTKISGNAIYSAEWGGASQVFSVDAYDMSTNLQLNKLTIIDIYRSSL